MSFSSAAKPGSYRKSCFLLSSSSRSVSKHALGMGDGMCSDSRWIWSQFWVNEFRYQEHWGQNELKPFWRAELLACEKQSCSGAVLQKAVCRNLCVCCLNQLCSQVRVAWGSPVVPFLRSVPQDGLFLMAGWILAGALVTVNALTQVLLLHVK